MEQTKLAPCSSCGKITRVEVDVPFPQCKTCLEEQKMELSEENLKEWAVKFAGEINAQMGMNTHESEFDHKDLLEAFEGMTPEQAVAEEIEASL